MRHETLCESITGLTDELMSATEQRARCKSDRKQPQKAKRHSRESESEKCDAAQPQMEHNWIINRMIGANNNKTHKHVHDRLRFGECARASSVCCIFCLWPCHSNCRFSFYRMHVCGFDLHFTMFLHFSLSLAYFWAGYRRRLVELRHERERARDYEYVIWP